MSENSKKAYEVLVPFAGSITVVIETHADPNESVEWNRSTPFEDEVINAVYEIRDPFNGDHDVDYEFLTKITQGNVLYASTNEIEVIEVIDE